MCRSIKTLRPPFTDDASDDDVRAAALQYVRKIAGMRQPSVRNSGTFDAAVEAVAAATTTLLAELEVRPTPPRPTPSEPPRSGTTDELPARVRS